MGKQYLSKSQLLDFRQGDGGQCHILDLFEPSMKQFRNFDRSVYGLWYLGERKDCGPHVLLAGFHKNHKIRIQLYFCQKKYLIMLQSFSKHIFVVYASTYLGHFCFEMHLMVTYCSLARAGVHVENQFCVSFISTIYQLINNFLRQHGFFSIHIRKPTKVHHRTILKNDNRGKIYLFHI